MCGIAGFLSPQGFELPEATALLGRMGATLAHRGPDDEGLWLDAGSGIGLAHRRLSIIDLSPAGHQPMVSPSGRHVIVFNGEIYNHGDLRRALPEVAWRGRSDTETLLAAIDAWGLDAALSRAVGMFALALWDRDGRRLSLARDRLGEKPLYCGWQGPSFVFASELKAIAVHPDFGGEIDRESLALQLRHAYVPAPRSIYRGIGKLPPGCVLTVSAGDREGVRRNYWSALEAARAGSREPAPGDDPERLAELERRLRQSIAGQRIADVPLGAFLSGGIDSSLVVALMQSMASEPVRTFTIGFDEQGFDEAGHARAVARHLGTDHCELYVSPEQAREVIPRLPAIYDEPFADASQIPTCLVSEMASRQVRVCLSGDGGDELFAGYTRYFWTAAVVRRGFGGPAGLRRALGAGLAGRSPRQLERLFAMVSPVLPARWRYANPAAKLAKLGEILAAATADDACRDAGCFWKDNENLVLGRSGRCERATIEAGLADLESRMMLLDQQTYLAEDILAKVDRAAMAVSLETRVPLLDHRVVEYAWSLPLAMKIRDGQGKWPLRQLLSRYVPRSLFERPKMGFSVPIDRWLRGPLRDWAEALLDGSRLAGEGWLDPAPIARKWREHVDGRRDWSADLWNVLMFEAWLEARREGAR